MQVFTYTNAELPQMGDEFVLSSDLTPERNKLIDTVRTLDEYETTIVQAYANRLIKSRKERGSVAKTTVSGAFSNQED
jgi:hypothetical protein